MKKIYSALQITIGIVFTAIGFILHIWLVSEAYIYLRTNYGTSVRFYEIRYQLREYMAFRRLSKVIQKRILTYYDFSFNGKFFRKREINVLLGKQLRHSVIAETRMQLLQKNDFFKQFPDELLNSIVDCMSEVIFLRNDVICNTESRAQVCMIMPCLTFISTKQTF